MPTTQTGIQYPASTDTHPSATWWQALAMTADASIRQMGDAAAEGRFFRRVLTTDDRLDDLREPGTYGVPSNSLGAAVGMPNGLAGAVRVEDSTNSVGLTIQEVWEYVGAATREGGRRYWRGSLNFSGGWGPWREIGADAPATPSTDAGLAHQVLVDAASRRRGGTIGTGGRAAVALRFDHGLGNFRDLILPELRRLRLPWSMAMNSGRWGLAENGGATAADLQTWCIEDGGEVWNHGRDHTDATNTAELTAQIVDGLTDLRGQLPKLAIEGWIVPGVGGTQYDGFGTGQDADRWDTDAGRLILGHHAFSTGHWAGRLRPLTGEPRPGVVHRGMDTTPPADVIATVDDAIATKSGVTVMVHPSVIGTAGNNTLANYVQVLEHIAARRDAGDLVVLPMSGLELADARHGDVHDLLAPMASSSSVAAGANLTRTRSLTDGLEHTRGAVRRVEVDVEAATAGTITVTVEGAGSRTLTLPSGRTTVARHVTVPLDATRVHVTVSPSVAATVHQVRAVTGPTSTPRYYTRAEVDAAVVAAVPRYTGVRDLTSVIAATATAGAVRGYRNGNDVTLAFDGLLLPAPTSTTWTTLPGNLPAGFRPDPAIAQPYLYFLPSVAFGTDTSGAIRVHTSGQIISYTNQGKTIRATFTFRTADAWPATLPGTPA